MMVKKSPEFFSQQYLPVLGACVSYAETARRLSINENTVYVWLRQSREAMKRGDDPSDYFFEFEDETKWFHEHVKSAVSNSIQAIEAAARSRALHGTYTVAKFQGQTVYKIDPDWFDEEMRDLLGLGEGDKYLRENGKLVPEMVWSPPAGDLVMAILAANSKRYRKQSSVSIDMQSRVSGGVLVVNGNSPAQVAAPLPVLQVLDAVAESERPLIDDAAPVDDAEPGEDDMTVTDTPSSPPATEISAPLPPAPASVRFSTPTPPEYQPGPNVLIQPRNGRPLSDLERDLLSKLPNSLTRVR
jgi:transposase-like protein